MHQFWSFNLTLDILQLLFSDWATRQWTIYLKPGGGGGGMIDDMVTWPKKRQCKTATREVYRKLVGPAGWSPQMVGELGNPPKMPEKIRFRNYSKLPR